MHISVVLNFDNTMLRVKPEFRLFLESAVNPYAFDVLPTKLAANLFLWRAQIDADVVPQHQGHHI